MITRSGFKIAINRIVKAVPDYKEITKVKFGTDQITPTEFDTDITKPVPYSKFAIVHNCDSTTNWSGSYSHSDVSINNTTYKEGTGSLNILKTSTSPAGYVGIQNSSLTSRNATDKYLSYWVYIKDQTILDKLNNSVLNTYYGTNSSNYYNLGGLGINVGWNNFFKLISDGSTTGSPNISDCKYFRINFSILSDSDTFVAGDIIIDDIFLVDADDLINDIDVGYPIINESDATATYRATLSSTEGNGFLINALGTFNEDATPLMQDIFKFPNISKDSGDEIIIEFRNRLVRRT